jgi:chemotaxis protein methyltransferase CheR
VGLSAPQQGDNIAAIRDWIRRETGIVLGPGAEIFGRRLSRIQERYGCSGLDDLRAALDGAEPASLREEVIDAATTQETSWFRDGATFDALRALVLSRGRPLSIWSAGCAYGQEIYSVAMLLAEANAFDQARLLATDISPHSLRRAREGRYLSWEMARGLSANRRERYFHREGSHWVLKPELREAVEFRSHDLRKGLSESFDLILCRHVLLYFDAATQRSALAKLARSLRPDGYLALGNVESLRRLEAPLRKVSMGGAAFYAPLPSM